MSDKKKSTQDQAQSESDRQFLERTNVSSQIKDVLAKIIENRPEDPIEFLADYFESLGDKGNRVAKAHQQICLTHHSKPAFQTNLIIAYDILSTSRASKPLKAVNGVVYRELLVLLCKKLPSTVNDKLLVRIGCRDYEVVPFDIFKVGVFTCLVLQDYIKQADELFLTLDSQGTGKVDVALCDTVCKQLIQAVKLPSDNPMSVVEASHMLGPNEVYSGISKALLKPSGLKGFMSRDDFVSHIAEAFILKVQTFH